MFFNFFIETKLGFFIDLVEFMKIRLIECNHNLPLYCPLLISLYTIEPLLFIDSLQWEFSIFKLNIGDKYNLHFYRMVSSQPRCVSHVVINDSI